MSLSWKNLQHLLFCGALLLWGGVLLYFYESDVLGVYLHPKFHIYVLIGGLVAVVIAVFNLITRSKNVGCGHDHAEADDDCGHEHGGDLNPLLALLLLAAPLCFSLAKTTHGVSAQYEETMSGRDLDASSMNLIEMPPFTLEMLEEMRDKSKDGAFQMNLLELFFSAGDIEQEKVMEGLYVETEAKLRSEPNRNASGKRMRLYRLFLTCCAADMKAIPVSIEFDGELPDISHQAWVKVAGELHYEREKGVVYPVIKVKRIKQIPPPEGAQGEVFFK